MLEDETETASASLLAVISAVINSATFLGGQADLSNTSSGSGDGGTPYKPERARKSAAIAGPADSTTANAPHNKMDGIITRTRTLIKAEGRE